MRVNRPRKFRSLAVGLLAFVACSPFLAGSESIAPGVGEVRVEVVAADGHPAKRATVIVAPRRAEFVQQLPPHQSIAPARSAPRSSPFAEMRARSRSFLVEADGAATIVVPTDTAGLLAFDEVDGGVAVLFPPWPLGDSLRIQLHAPATTLVQVQAAPRAPVAGVAIDFGIGWTEVSDAVGRVELSALDRLALRIWNSSRGQKDEVAVAGWFDESITAKLPPLTTEGGVAAAGALLLELPPAATVDFEIDEEADHASEMDGVVSIVQLRDRWDAVDFIDCPDFDECVVPLRAGRGRWWPVAPGCRFSAVVATADGVFQSVESRAPAAGATARVALRRVADSEWTVATLRDASNRPLVDTPFLARVRDGYSDAFERVVTDDAGRLLLRLRPTLERVELFGDGADAAAPLGVVLDRSEKGEWRHEAGPITVASVPVVLAGSVRDETGAPMVGAAVRCFSGSSITRSSRLSDQIRFRDNGDTVVEVAPAAAISDDSGRFVVRGFLRPGEPLRWRVDEACFGGTSHGDATSGVLDQTLVIASRGLLNGRCLLADGFEGRDLSVRFVPVEVTWDAGAGFFSGEATVEDDGRFHSGPLAPGTWDVVLTLKGTLEAGPAAGAAARVDRVLVERRRKCADPRLAAIDLRDGWQVTTLTVVDDAGRPIPEGTIWAKDGAATHWSNELPADPLVVPWRREAPSVTLFAPAWRRQEVVLRPGAQRVELVPGPARSIVVSERGLPTNGSYRFELTVARKSEAKGEAPESNRPLLFCAASSEAQEEVELVSGELARVQVHQAMKVQLTVAVSWSSSADEGPTDLVEFARVLTVADDSVAERDPFVVEFSAAELAAIAATIDDLDE